MDKKLVAMSWGWGDTHTLSQGWVGVFCIQVPEQHHSQRSWSDPRTETKLTLPHPGFMFLLLSACCPLWDMSCKTQFY